MAAAIAVGLAAAISVVPPTDVPSIALQAAVVYRAEVGAAVFFSLYLVTLAFALALQNRGFTEIGGGGIKAQDLASLPRDLADAEVAAELIDEVAEQLTAFEQRMKAGHDVS